MFVALMKQDEAARSLLVDVVPEAFPWIRFLPTQDIRAFVLEPVETLQRPTPSTTLRRSSR